MSLRDAPRKPQASGPPTGASIFMGWLWDCIAGGKFPFTDTDTIKITRGRQGYAFNVVSKGGGSGSPPIPGYAGDYNPIKTYSKYQTVRVMVSDNLTFRFWFLYAALKNVPISQAIPAQQPPAYQLIATLPGANGYQYVFGYFLTGIGPGNPGFPPGNPNGPGGFGDTEFWQLLSFNSLQFQAFP